MRSLVAAAGFVAAAVVVAVVTAGCRSFAGDYYEEARSADLACVEARTEPVDDGARDWVAVQGGAVVAVAPTAGDAARAADAAASAAATVRHRYVYRAPDRGERLYRLAYLPVRGLVGGRRLLADLGFRVVSAGGPDSRSLTIDRLGARRTLDLNAQPRLTLELRDVGATSPEPALVLDILLDPDFDGPLLLPEGPADALALDLAEIPGDAEVQVALGRPFMARRAWAEARCPALDAAGPVEILTRRVRR